MLGRDRWKAAPAVARVPRRNDVPQALFSPQRRLLSLARSISDPQVRIINTSAAPRSGAEVRTVRMGRKLYVGNLPYSAGEQDLEQLFAGCGTVESVKIMRDMATGRARGFGFVEMATDEEAQKAIDQLHDHNFGGRNLTVNEAKPMPARSGGGGFGGGGGGLGGGGGRREPRW